MDKILDSYMQQQGVEEDALNDFYKSLQGSMKAYEEINEHTMDTLYAIINFAHFKKQMLEYKVGMKD